MTKWVSALAFVTVFGLAGVAHGATPSFDELDLNKDGVLSESEVASVKELDFAKADTNKDGMLSRSEYKAAIS